MSDILSEAKLVKPLLEKPYIATEVNKLSDTMPKPTIPINQMTSATIVGQSDTSSKEEKPTIYSTVIRRKPTSVTRPIPVSNVILPKVNIQSVLPQVHWHNLLVQFIMAHQLVLHLIVLLLVQLLPILHQWVGKMLVQQPFMHSSDQQIQPTIMTPLQQQIQQLRYLRVQ